MDISLKEALPMLLAGGSFLLSLYTLWLTQLRRGRLKMTQPTLICLKREHPTSTPKIFLRTLLFSTASKGRVIENMLLRVHQPAGIYIFDFWGYGETSKLNLGSGLFVGPTGVAYNHHFNPKPHAEHFLFSPGQYRVEILATTIGKRKLQKLMEVTFEIDAQQSAELIQINDSELFLIWNAESRTYEGRLERRPRSKAEHTSLKLDSSLPSYQEELA